MTKKCGDEGSDRAGITETCGAMQWKSVARNPRPRSAMQHPSMIDDRLCRLPSRVTNRRPPQQWPFLHAWAARIFRSLFRAWRVGTKEELCQSRRRRGSGRQVVGIAGA